MSNQGLGRALLEFAFPTGSSTVKLKEKGELLPGKGLEGNEYYIKPLPFREFALQSVDFLSAQLTRDEFWESLNRLEPVLKECSIDLSYSLEDIRNETQKVFPFKRELG